MIDDAGASREAGELDAAALDGVAGGAGPVGRPAPTQPSGNNAGMAVEAFAPEPPRPSTGANQVAEKLASSLQAYGLPHEGATASPSGGNKARDELADALKKNFSSGEAGSGTARSTPTGPAGKDAGTTAQALETVLGNVAASAGKLAGSLERTGTSKSEIEVPMFGSGSGTGSARSDEDSGATTRSGGGRPRGRG